ncbi:TPA: hypothetical protein N0F65_009203 [Lagenidium giganteum]|uniref:FAD-binding domain-containing protein n=1 Tax=Lagenidium giganteum TaxID=4803 RepID=A0AAV2YMF7_9STRA|nr:TPA: hypothetical protein N0F65_009193 [Lagenidium giganteum]DAZ95807.1 TPA: hypothetical protein N0F65_009203 [Lagenidium giganteum]
MASTSSIANQQQHAPLRIAIIGAGPVGLTLASVLQKQQRDFLQQHPGHPAPLFTLTIYEADQDEFVRSPGGSLDLRQGSGLQAIQAAGLMDAFHAVARPEGQYVLVLSKHGECLHEETSADQDDTTYHPEIGRSHLNKLLRDSLAPGTIQWGHKLLRVMPGDDNAAAPHVLEFANHKRVTADLVVGADGTWSRIRPHVSAHKPKYSGVSFIDCAVRDFDQRFPELVQLVGDGALYSFSQNRNIYAQRNDDGVVRVYAALRVDEDWHKHSPVAVARTDAERVQLLIDTYYHDWDERLHQLLWTVVTLPVDNKANSNNDDDKSDNEPSNMVIRPIYVLPLNHHWTHKRGFTLIGDAAHVMSPCAGEGVNTGMKDALDLAMAIMSSCTSSSRASQLPVAIAAFEASMFSRAGAAAAKSARNLDVFFASKVATREDALKIFARHATAA